jgi:hypothetical protein
MEVMESLESSPVGAAREVVAAMVLPVVHEGEIVVSGIQPEYPKGGEPGRKDEPEQPPECQRHGHDDEEWRADERSGLCVVLRVTAPRHRGWAVQDPPMYDVLEQSKGHEPHEGDAAGHDPGAGESIEPEGQKCQRCGQVAEHHHPVIGRAADHPFQGAKQDPSGLSGHQCIHSILIRPPTLRTRSDSRLQSANPVVIVMLYLISSVKILAEYERGVIFRLGKLLPQPKGPGVILVFAPIDRIVRVSLRTVAFEVTPQDVITRDNVSVKVSAVLDYRVVDPRRSIVDVEHYQYATLQLAQTTRRSVLGHRTARWCC